MSRQGNERVVLTGPRPVDALGDPTGAPGPEIVADWSAVWPRGVSSEETFRASTTIEGVVALLPSETAGLEALAASETGAASYTLTWRGRIFDIVGEIGTHVFLDGTIAGYQLNAVRHRG